MDKMQTHELISALTDGQLQGEAFALGVKVAAGDPAAREAWHTYHLIGDVLRSGEYATGTAPMAFMDRLQSRLLEERQASSARYSLEAVPVEMREPARHTPANDASFRWKLLAGVASLAAMAAIGWTVLASSSDRPQAQLASIRNEVMSAAGESGVMIRDPRLDELLAAHRQFGMASALQMPAGFLRNATFEEPAR